MKKLSEIPDKNPFRVPENYFEEVNRKIISATIGIENEEKKIGIYKRLRPYLLVAASVTGFIILSYAGWKLFTPEKSEFYLSELLLDSDSELYINDIDLHALEESAASVIEFAEMPSMEDSELIDYILLEDFEINDIYEQL